MKIKGQLINKILVLFCLVLVTASHAFSQNEQNNARVIKLMTYNLKFASSSFEPSWQVRRDWQVEMIKQYDPDIIGTQEGLKEQIDYLAKMLPEYEVVGEGRKGGDNDEHMAIFYKRDKFRLRELQSFALSKTPGVIGSGPAVNPRIVTWARLALVDIANENETGKYPQDYRGHWQNTQEFYVFNTHFFNGGAELSRYNAAHMVLNKINELDRFGEWEEERPLFLMGDFNCKPNSEPYNVLVGNDASPSPKKLRNSFVDKDKIDWVLYKGNVKIIKYEAVDFNKKGKYPSDHKPIYVEVELNK